jgi:hypothetical protein
MLKNNGGNCCIGEINGEIVKEVFRGKCDMIYQKILKYILH